jgi:hypothetical protein
MSASKKAKDGGLKSLKEMSQLVDVPVTTLTDWEKTRTVTFDALVIGAAEKKKRQTGVSS